MNDELSSRKTWRIEMDMVRIKAAIIGMTSIQLC